MRDAAYFDGELQDLAIEGASVLEIGFGFGDFVIWAGKRGVTDLVVTEIDPFLIEAAEERGLVLLPAAFETVASEHVARFDTVVAFDVFEHFTLDEIRTRLEALETMIKPGGHLLMRFPNGQSPFGLAHQNGDPTHKTALSRAVFALLIQGSNFEPVRYGPTFRLPRRSLPGRMLQVAHHALRYLLESFFNALYGQNIIYDPIVVLVLRRR